MRLSNDKILTTTKSHNFSKPIHNDLFSPVFTNKFISFQFAGEYESKETEKSSTSEAPQTEVQPTAQYFQEAQPMKEVPSRLKLQPAERLSEPKLLTASEVIPPKFSPEISGPFSITSKNHQKPHSSRHRNHHENKATGTQVHHILKVLAQGSHNHEQGEQVIMH